MKNNKMRQSRKKGQLLPIMLLLGGCASYDPNDHYDPNAVEKVGVITSKSLAIIEPSRSSNPQGHFVPVPMNGTVKMVYMPDVSRQRHYREFYEYLVWISENQTVSVLDEYSAFEVGDCAKVFLSPNPSYPRIASGSGCVSKPRQNADTPAQKVQSISIHAKPAKAERALQQEALRKATMERGTRLPMCGDAVRCIEVGRSNSDVVTDYISKVIHRTQRVSDFTKPSSSSLCYDKTMRLRVVIDTNGFLGGVYLINSSGDSSLDNWAIKTLHMFSPVQPFGDKLSELADRVIADLLFQFDRDGALTIVAEPI